MAEQVRSYPDFRTMARAEAARPEGIEAVAIVTPNHMHAAVAEAFMETGVHIICDKPLTSTLEEARRLRDKARAAGIFAVTYNYSGYPLVRHAPVPWSGPVNWARSGSCRLNNRRTGWPGRSRAPVRSGRLAHDPACSRAGGCIGDIGTHAYQPAHFGRRFALKRGWRDLDDGGAMARKLPGNVILDQPSPAGVIATASSQWEFNDRLDKEKEPSDIQDGPQVVLGGRSQARVQLSR